MRYGAERLMYRLGQSEYAANFVLKGAMLFLVWTGAQYRTTKDMDLLALKSASVERLRDIFREICVLPVAPDGLVFEPDSVGAEEIREDNLYQGVRVTLVARLGGCEVLSRPYLRRVVLTARAGLDDEGCPGRQRHAGRLLQARPLGPQPDPPGADARRAEPAESAPDPPSTASSSGQSGGGQP